MKQVQSFSSADMVQSMMPNLKGRQKGTNLEGMLQNGENPQGMMNFKGLLLGRQEISGMTKEQEQTLAMAAAGMTGFGAFMLQETTGSDAQMAAAGLTVLPGALAGGQEAAGMQTVNAHGILTAGDGAEPVDSSQGAFAEGILETADAAQPVQMTAVLHAGSQEAGEQNADDGTQSLLKMPETSDEAKPEVSEDTSGEAKLEASENSAGEAKVLNWQETMFMQQDIAAKAAEKPQTHETMKVQVPNEIPKSLSELTAQKVKEGVQSFEIQIEPENLGKIAVKVEYHSNQAMISIVCSETKTLELLRNHADDIGAVIQKNLQQETIVYVDERKAEAFYQQDSGNSDAGRESEWERHKEERQRKMRNGGSRFLQELRLGLLE